ncbi:hypothetical protein RKD47_006591 [Streptomyces albogriseolus]
MAFGRAEQVDRSDGPPGVLGDGAQEAFQAFAEGLHGAALEQLGAVLPVAADPGPLAVGGVLLDDGETEVELGEAHPHRLHGDVQARQGRVGGGHRLQGEDHLEERVAGERPLGVELLDELLERQVLVGVGGQVDLAHPAHEVAEGGVA